MHAHWFLIPTRFYFISSLTARPNQEAIRGVYFWNVNLGVYYKLEKKIDFESNLIFFFEFELDLYCLCSLQKSISISNWFLNLIFRNWKKIEWHWIFQKSSEDRQGDCLTCCINKTVLSWSHPIRITIVWCPITCDFEKKIHIHIWIPINICSS